MTLHLVANSRSSKSFPFGDHDPRAYVAFDINGELSIDTMISRRLSSGIGFEVSGAARKMLSEGFVYAHSRLCDSADDNDQLSSDDIVALCNSLSLSSFERIDAENIPACFTYFAQFVLHDIIEPGLFDPARSSIEFPHACLDLSSLLSEPAYTGTGLNESYRFAGLEVGRASSDEHCVFADLPRFKNGSVAIPRCRNDQNLGLAQTHVLMIKFYQTLSHLFSDRTAADIRRLARRAIQSIVLWDYLPRLIPHEVFRSVLAAGRQYVLPNSANGFRNELVPIEAAAAFLRYGHSQVRHSYNVWSRSGEIATPTDLVEFTGNGCELSVTGNCLPESWVIDWQRFLDPSVEGGPDRIRASAIDFNLPPLMHDMPDRFSPFQKARDVEKRQFVSMPMMTLLRQRAMKLPTAQRLIEDINNNLCSRKSAIACLSATEMEQSVEGLFGRLRRYHVDGAAIIRRIADRTPLWFYMLSEAKASENGQKLGPLAGRIVMETLHAAIQGDKDGILVSKENVNSLPELKPYQNGSTFRFTDLASVVAAHWPGNLVEDKVLEGK